MTQGFQKILNAKQVKIKIKKNQYVNLINEGNLTFQIL